jgi:murein DD-endopeptidase MepM/ murein hydrolase activator NlpD
MYKKSIIALITPLIITSCATQPPAVVQQRSNYYYGINGVAKFIIVQPGQTLLEIATQNGVPIFDIAATNKISPPYRIYAGQRLKLPAEIYHTVAPGETLLGIANKHTVSFTSLATANKLEYPYNIRIGQQIKVPNNGRANIDQLSMNRPKYEAPQTVVINTPVEKTSAIAPIEPLEEEIVSKPEVRLEPKPNSTPSVKKPVVEKQEPQDAYNDQDFEDLEKQLTMATKSKPQKLEMEDTAPLPYKLATPLGSKNFTWPVNGKIISRFGNKSDKFAEGITISARLNTPVLAASDGEVIYVGNDVEGYGKMVIIRHNEDILSAYANNASVLVKKGDKVRKGDSIAKVGKTGDVDNPQLYFSLRKGKSTINPEAKLQK